ncbi:MAG TPA: glycosyltransferase, partial [Tepidisphaeraceae bacterium]|nr:glycosyltransferase [Tepidisphaeraceae bacterium]
AAGDVARDALLGKPAVGSLPRAAATAQIRFAGCRLTMGNQWAILTGEYPPSGGGVSDYTHQIARGLAAAGDVVHVWTPEAEGSGPSDPGVTVHSLPDRYSPRSLARLRSDLSQLKQPYRLLLQYTPMAFGFYGANYPFAFWLAAQRAPVWVMFHELYMPLRRGQPMRYNALALVQRLTLALVMHSTERVFVSIPAWGEMLAPLIDHQPVQWLPIPSGVAVEFDPSRVDEIREKYLAGAGTQLLGHFGTFGPPITAIFEGVLEQLLDRDGGRVMLLMGRGSEAFAERFRIAHPALSSRVHAAGSLEPRELSAHLSACDLLVQPFPDGVSTRRSSLVAGMALGVPTVAPVGRLSEPFWTKEKPILVAQSADVASIVTTAERALANPAERIESGHASKRFYQENLDVKRTIDLLRS